MNIRFLKSALAGGLVGLGLAGATSASAFIQIGDAQISGSLSSQTLMMHDGTSHWELAQVRNLFKGSLEYNFLKRGKAFGRYKIPGIRSATFYADYRGGYDPVFALRDGYFDRWDESTRNDLSTESEIRELYLDFASSSVGSGRLNVRIGRQQVVWGEADVVRSLDVINPLDLRRSFLLGADQPNLDEYRIPLWMLRATYSWGQLGPIANAAIEALYIPADIEPLRGRIGEVTNFPFDMERRPSSAPFERVRHPFEITRIGTGHSEIPAQAVIRRADQMGGPIVADVVWFDRTTPFADSIVPPKNDIPSRAWIDHAEVGGRFLGQFSILHRSFDFSLNYFYTYSDVPGAFADFPAVAAGLFGNPGTRDPETGAGLTFGPTRDLGNQATLWVPAALEYPRTHVFGGTLTYSDVDLTGSILRLEVSHQTHDPRIKPRPPFLAEREGEFTLEDFEATFQATGATTRAMFGVDLFRSWPFLDPVLGPGQPIFISAQGFVEYKEDISNTIGTLLDVNDRQRRWNPLYTLLAQYFAKGGRWVYVFIALYDQDPNHFAMAPSFEYHPRNWLTFKFGQIWFMGGRYNQSSRFLHAFADRDQTFLKVQYSF